MDLYEVEGKRLLKEYGIPVDSGFLWTEGCDTAKLTYPCVIKAQVLSGKRGKSGGICFAKNDTEFEYGLEQVCNVEINGKKAQGVYITPFVDISREHYLGLTLDPSNKNILLIYTPEGGMNIEELAESNPAALLKVSVMEQLKRDDMESRLKKMDLSQQECTAIIDIAEKILSMFWELDATTIEINPLAQQKDGAFLALDAKVVLDDNALYRHEDYTLIPRSSSYTERELLAQKYDLSYVEVDKSGNIGLIAGGAGIGMATVDTIYYYGGVPFNFLDLGGGVTAEKTYQAMRLLLGVPNIKGILVNVFGGGNNCAVMAQGIVKAIRESGMEKKIVVKSRGFFQEDGWKAYDELGISQVHYGTTDDAVKMLLSEMGDME